MPNPVTYQATLSQGATDFSPYVAYDGVKQSFTERAEASVKTLDGTLHKHFVNKRVLEVELRALWHEDLVALFAGVSQLAQWSYLDANLGPRTAYFYLSGPTVQQTLARGGKTLCTGVTFQLEEQ